MGSKRIGVAALVAVSAISLGILNNGIARAQTGQLAPPASLVLSDYTILTLAGTIGGLTPQDRIDRITERMTPVLSNAGITPDNVVVYLPPGGTPVIYVLGRKAVTVDSMTAKALGYSDPVKLAKIWAAKFQQVLPRICWRPPNAAEPVIPENPPLKVTRNLSEVGGEVGTVVVYNKVVMVLRGPQPGGLTAAERADMLHSRIQMLAYRQTKLCANDVAVVPQAPDSASSVEIDLASNPIYVVTPVDAQLSHEATPAMLAAKWATNLRNALHLSDIAPMASPVQPQTPAPDSPAPATSAAPISPGDIGTPPPANPAPSAGATSQPAPAQSSPPQSQPNAPAS